MLNLFRKNKKYTEEELFRALQKDGIAITEQDIQKARKDNPETLYKIGNAYYKKKKYKKAFAWFQRATLLGHGDSQAQVGWMYCYGEGVSEDNKQALDWSIKAASAGNAKGQVNIGYLYYRGWGVPQDYKQAMDWYLKAANNGNIEAMYYIGIMYQNGEGVTTNILTAIKWYTKAAIKGDRDAQYHLGLIYKEKFGFQDPQEAVNWFQKVADNGDYYAKNRAKELNELGYYAKYGEQRAITQSYHETIQSNDINNNQTQPSTTIINNDNSIENLERMFQSNIGLVEVNTGALQKELAALKQEKLEQHEENKLLKERLARMEAGMQNDGNNDLNYDSSDDKSGNEDEINYDSEYSNDEEDGALKKKLTALKHEKLEQVEENRLLKERLARMETGLEDEAHNDPNCYTSDDESDSNNDINYDTECSNDEGEDDNNAPTNTHQSNSHRQWFETPADPNYDSSDNEDPKNDIYLD